MIVHGKDKHLRDARLNPTVIEGVRKMRIIWFPYSSYEGDRNFLKTELVVWLREDARNYLS